jgi:hypothetical protein
VSSVAVMLSSPAATPAPPIDRKIELEYHIGARACQ